MGNPTSYLGKTLTWDGKQLKKAEFGSGSSYYYYEYKYDENGLRTRKTFSAPALSLSETTEYYYNGSVLIGMKIGSGSTAKFLRFSYDASGNVVAVDYSTDNGSSFTTYYYLRNAQNAQNDIVKIIDSTGAAVVEYIYDSWGKVIASTGTLTTTLGTDQPFRYRGYVYDTETGWYYLQSRYYDPNTCRFISADVLLSTGQGVIGNNNFAYCGNNPIIRADESGYYYRPPRTWVETWTDDEINGGERMPDRFYIPWLNRGRDSSIYFFGEGQEQEALDAFYNGDIVYYRGARLLENVITDSSFSYLGAIFLTEGDMDYMMTVLRHEYGHVVQWRKLGIVAYTLYVAIPSVAVWRISQYNKTVYDNYFSFPWERGADYYGGVNNRANGYFGGNFWSLAFYKAYETAALLSSAGGVI